MVLHHNPLVVNLKRFADKYTPHLCRESYVFDYVGSELLAPSSLEVAWVEAIKACKQILDYMDSFYDNNRFNHTELLH